MNVEVTVHVFQKSAAENLRGIVITHSYSRCSGIKSQHAARYSEMKVALSIPDVIGGFN
jgi:hypothetical protein